MEQIPVTLKSTKKLVNLIKGAVDADGFVQIKNRYDGRLAWVKPDAIERVKKYVRGALLEVTFCGQYTDAQGRVWDCWTPISNRLSAWVRMECSGHRPQMVYDAGGGFRASLDMTMLW